MQLHLAGGVVGMGSSAPPIGSSTIDTSVCMTTSKSYDVIGMEAKQVNF